ncbi:MAG: hypothetical protein VKL58_07240 [Cyanobacteriota bacterium]|nr:hypothetical protein [Cyanobacteriota bacterium]
MPQPPANASESQKQYGNADSFAMAFDDAWRLQTRQAGHQDISRSESLERILAQLADHPFAQKDAATARQVGEFRLRLHGV